MRTWLGLDGGWADHAAAEHAVGHLLDAAGVDPRSVVSACTHLVRGGQADGHVAVTVELEAPATVDVLHAVPAGTAAAVESAGTNSAGGDGPGTNRAGSDGAGPPGLLADARGALARHRAGTAGRAFRYQGLAAVAGPMPVAALTAATAIDRVVDLAGRVLGDAEVVQTFGYARPQLTDGFLTLAVAPYADDQHIPFELENPSRCCEFH